MAPLGHRPARMPIAGIAKRPAAQSYVNLWIERVRVSIAASELDWI